MHNKKFRMLSALLIFALVLSLVPMAQASSGNERRIYQFLTQELHLNSAAACGVLANIEAESGFETGIHGDSGSSFGICQWHAGRYSALRHFCLSRGLDYESLEGQLQYLAYELRGPHSDTYKALRSVENTSDGAYEAGYIWCFRFEIPADRQNAAVRRGRTAQMKYWPRYGDPNAVGSGDFESSIQPGSNSYFTPSVPDSVFYWETEEAEETEATVPVVQSYDPVPIIPADANEQIQPHIIHAPEPEPEPTFDFQWDYHYICHHTGKPTCPELYFAGLYTADGTIL